MKYLLFLIFSIYFQFNIAQQRNLDSFFVSLKKEEVKNSDVFYKKLHEFRDIAIKANNKNHLLNAYKQLGINFTIKQRFDSGFVYFSKVLSICENSDDKLAIANAKMNIGIVLRYQKSYLKAEEYFNTVYESSIALKDKKLETQILYNLSGLYLDWGKYRKGISINNKAYKIACEENDITHQVKTLESLGSNYSELHMLDSAKLYLITAYEKAKSIKYEDEMAYLCNNIAGLQLQLKNYGLAKSFLKEAEIVAIKNNNLNVLVNIFGNYADLYELTKQLKDCAFYFRKKDSLKAVIYNDQILSATAEMEVKYESEKKELQLQEANTKILFQSEKNKQKNIIIWLGAITLLGTSFFAVIAFINFKKAKKLTKVTEEQKQIVLAKQNEILASIRYAKRIQQSLMPNEKYINGILNKHIKH